MELPLSSGPLLETLRSKAATDACPSGVYFLTTTLRVGITAAICVSSKVAKPVSSFRTQTHPFLSLRLFNK